MTERITFSVDDELAERINSRLSWGDNRSELLREAIRRGLDDMESADPEPRRDGVEAPSEPDVDQRVTAAVDAVASSWADDDRLAQRKEAARRVLAYAVEADEAVGKSSEIVGETFEAVPVTGQDRETWWRKNVRPVLAEAGDYSSGEHGYVVD